MFEYIFGITWKEYTKTNLDINNGLTYLISLVISLLLFGWWGIPIWVIFIGAMVAGGGAWIIK